MGNTRMAPQWPTGDQLSSFEVCALASSGAGSTNKDIIIKIPMIAR
jgi:hypothetical protein